MATDVNEAWRVFCEHLPCVDEEYLKRAFADVWLTRGSADSLVTTDRKSKQAIRKLDQLPFDREPLRV